LIDLQKEQDALLSAEKTNSTENTARLMTLIEMAEAARAEAEKLAEQEKEARIEAERIAAEQ